MSDLDKQSRDDIYARAIAAETAWSIQLRKHFGRDACNARYETRGRGVPGGALREAYDARTAAMAALHAYWDSRRMIRA